MTKHANSIRYLGGVASMDKQQLRWAVFCLLFRLNSRPGKCQGITMGQFSPGSCGLDANTSV